MQLARPSFAMDPKLFGRGRRWVLALPESASISSDVKLFATTFAAGFLVVSILIG
jgi:hypothetical protein